MFDTSLAMASAAMQGFGVALLPPSMFATDLQQGRLVRPFGVEIALGGYWLTRLKSRPLTDAMAEFRHWLLHEVNAGLSPAPSPAGSKAAPH